MNMNVYEKLLAIQNELKAPKNRQNKFGGYSYRSCEDILEAVKPLLKKYKAIIRLNDRIEQIGDRYYVNAQAFFYDVESEDGVTCAEAYAREPEDKKGMDAAQITGTASSWFATVFQASRPRSVRRITELLPRGEDAVSV